MVYYLETNALYSIEKIIEKKDCNCFTSIFSLLEIVSGIDKANFPKRKAILQKIINSDIKIDGEMPEQIIFKSFDVSKKYEFEEHRLFSLFGLIRRIVKAECFEEIIQANKEDRNEFTLDYFAKLDESWNKSFVEATKKGNSSVSKAIKNTRKVVNLDSRNVKLEKNRDLGNLFKAEPSLSRKISIMALSEIIKRKGIDESKNEIYKTYNGLVEYFIQGLSDYCDEKMISHNEPANNDFSDLTHLVYLRNYKKNIIVSDDKIFERYFKGGKIKVNEFINKLE